MTIGGVRAFGQPADIQVVQSGMAVDSVSWASTYTSRAKDRKESELRQQPEQVKRFGDLWLCWNLDVTGPRVSLTRVETYYFCGPSWVGDLVAAFETQRGLWLPKEIGDPENLRSGLMRQGQQPRTRMKEPGRERKRRNITLKADSQAVSI